MKLAKLSGFDHVISVIWKILWALGSATFLGKMLYNLATGGAPGEGAVLQFFFFLNMGLYFMIFIVNTTVLAAIAVRKALFEDEKEVTISNEHKGS